MRNLMIGGRRVQVIWWGFRWLFRWRLYRWYSTCLRVCFDYSLLAGPLEIRVWHRVKHPTPSELP
jgi:hypothetical protein